MIEDDENEMRAQRMIDAIENGEEPHERPVREMPPKGKYYGERKPRKRCGGFPKKRSAS